jgi:SP family sugar:H+ symporter-like MFS transporter
MYTCCNVLIHIQLYAFFGHYCVSQTGPISANSAGIAMVIFTCMAILGFATTWGPLAWVVCAEIFPPQWKATGMGAATATNWTFNFLIGFFTKKVTASIGYGLGWVFAGSILVGATFVWVFVHETQGKSLEEIDREILEGSPAWRSRKGKD